MRPDRNYGSWRWHGEGVGDDGGNSDGDDGGNDDSDGDNDDDVDNSQVMTIVMIIVARRR